MTPALGITLEFLQGRLEAHSALVAAVSQRQLRTTAMAAAERSSTPPP
jgi:hypothetical protein